MTATVTVSYYHNTLTLYIESPCGRLVTLIFINVSLTLFKDSLQRLAKLSVSKMPTRKYKKKKGSLTSQESDNCAICLDEFSKGQVHSLKRHFLCISLLFIAILTGNKAKFTKED